MSDSVRRSLGGAVVEGGGQNAAAMKRRPVLIVDDEPDVQRGLREMLELAGFPVRVASNGSEALDLIGDGVLPGLVLVDLRMPVMSGWELVEVLRGDTELRKLPLVVLSADLDGRRLDVTAFLSKPVQTEHLLATVEGHYRG
jgi:CheY-like chemotaxis protein